MGVYIPNMKMPKSCNECMSECINIPLECYPDGDTVPDCPLIEIDLPDDFFPDVVRCGECKHWYRNNPPIDEECDIFPNADDFCPYGERRTDDKTEESRP